MWVGIYMYKILDVTFFVLKSRVGCSVASIELLPLLPFSGDVCPDGFHFLRGKCYKTVNVEDAASAEDACAASSPVSKPRPFSGRDMVSDHQAATLSLSLQG